jgi:fructose-1,6-bisphosphatase/inositol monophosphatase family enzyme
MASGICTYGAVGVIVNILSGETWYGSWGTGSAAASRSSTELSSEATESRVECALSVTTISVTDDTLVISFAMTCNATAKTIRNAGVFSAAGTLLFILSFDGVPVVNGQTINFLFRARIK